MTISPLALTAKKVIDAAWRNSPSYDLSSQAAFALESAQLLQSPEAAAELAGLRARAAELEGLYRESSSYASQLEARLAVLEKIPFSLGDERPVDEDPITYALTEKADASADKLTRLFAPTQALREEKTTPAGTEVTPTGPTGRVRQLLDAIRTARGEWPVHRAAAFYRDRVPALRSMPHTHLKRVARGDLRDLHVWGHLDRHDPTGARRFYTLKTRKDHA